jgi:hypothetical protein
MSRAQRRGGVTLWGTLGVSTLLPLYLLLGGPDPAPAAATGPARPGLAGAQQGVTCAMLPAGIRQQESGGRYRVRGVPVLSHGGDRALGAYQVMPDNLGPWSREVLGRTVTEREFMASRSLQDRIAGVKIRQLCEQHGPRGAAAAWFSGRPELDNDTRSRGGGAASVAAYVDSVMALARRTG